MPRAPVPLGAALDHNGTGVLSSAECGQQQQRPRRSSLLAGQASGVSAVAPEIVPWASAVKGIPRSLADAMEARGLSEADGRKVFAEGAVNAQLFAGLDDLELANSNIDVTACNRRREQALNARKVQIYLDTVGLSPEARLALGTAQLHQQGNSRSP